MKGLVHIQLVGHFITDSFRSSDNILTTQTNQYVPL